MKRRLTPDDLLRREGLGEVSISPDGRRVAFVMKRSRLSARCHKHDFLDGGDRSDVWLLDREGREPENLTSGEKDGWGYWAPAWSPAGTRLAMLSTREDTVGLWVYDVESGSLARVCDRAVDLVWWRDRPALWVSDERLLLPVLPEGERPLAMTVELQAAETAMREWPKAWRGEAPTASVLESGRQPVFGERPQGELLSIDVAAGTSRSVMSGFFRGLELSPDKRHVAFARQVEVVRPEPNVRLPGFYRERRRFGVMTTEGEAIVEGALDVEQVFMTPLRWSPDASEVAVIAHAHASPESGARLFRCQVADGRVEPATPADLEPVSFLWAAEGLVVLAGPVQGNEQEKTEARHWWHVGTGGEPRNLTAEMASVPRALIAEQGLSSFVGVADGNVIRITLGDGKPAPVTESMDLKITSIAWPEKDAFEGAGYRQLVVEGEGDGPNEWRALDLQSGALTAVAKPAFEASIRAFAPDHGTAMLACADRTGDRLWLSQPAFESRVLVCERNAWLADIAEGEVRRIEYASLDGEDLKGWLLLPASYREGARYPLVVEVYPGAMVERSVPPALRWSINGHHSLNPQLLAAHGYAVLFPSMPLKPEGDPGDPYFELTKGVMPAIDKAIELGVADPGRLGVMGQSFGGYGVYGLITQTRRFRAAVACAGLSDLVSLYGEFDPRMRYDHHPHENLFQPTAAESGQIRMGKAPWEDAARYVRNSPVFHADRVETPLLIIQGDMDYVPIQQGEEFFTALYRQGKPARFVRYWGEGHVLASPPNIEDMWDRIYDWFDQHLAPGADADSEPE